MNRTPRGLSSQRFRARDHAERSPKEETLTGMHASDAAAAPAYAIIIPEETVARVAG